MRAFERMSERSRYRRFFTAMRELGPGTLAYLTEVDQQDHVAIIALDDADLEAVGVARFVRSQTDPHSAEAAVTVIDDWQGRGLGHVLLRRLASLARRGGVHRFTAVVKVENPAAIDLLRGVGRAEVSRAGSELELLIELPQLGMGATLTRALRAAAAGAVSLGSRRD